MRVFNRNQVPQTQQIPAQAKKRFDAARETRMRSNQDTALVTTNRPGPYLIKFT